MSLAQDLSFDLGGDANDPPRDTRATLRSRARIRADQDGSDFPTDAQYNIFLDEGARETLADLVMSGWPVDYITATVVTNGVNQAYGFGGANAVFAVSMVYTSFGGQFTELRRVNPGHIAALRTGASTVGQASRYYEVRTGWQGAVIEFFPRIAGTYYVDFIPDFPGFSSDDMVWLGPPRSDELIVLKTAAKAVRKEGRVPDAQALDAEYDKLLLKVKELASWYDMRNPAQIRDTNAMSDPFSFRDAEFFAGPGGMF